MPEFEDQARSDAPPEEVWKLLYDPARFPDWWAGVGSVEPGGAGEYTMYPDGYPDFPMAQQLRVTESGVTISCLVSDLVFEWRLAMLDGGAATSITVHVEIPEAEAHRLAAQQEVISQSLSRLAALAAAESRLPESAVSDASAASGCAAADQPDGRGDEQHRQREQPAALDPLKRPEPAARLVPRPLRVPVPGEVAQHAEVVRVLSHRACRPRRARRGRVDLFPRGVDDLVHGGGTERRAAPGPPLAEHPGGPGQ